MDNSVKIRSFIDLEAWKESHKLVIMIYQSTKKFPKEEMFGLTNQMRRAVVSITSNIAEGFSRNSYKEKAQFYAIALGSLTEVQSQLFIARDIKYIEDEESTKIIDQTILASRIINGLLKKSREKSLNS